MAKTERFTEYRRPRLRKQFDREGLLRFLRDAGFRKVDDKQVRFYEESTRTLLRKGTVRVLTPSAQQPYITLQKMSGSRVHWFVDFPLEIPVQSVLDFADGVQ